jgi:hypothetical protein
MAGLLDLDGSSPNQGGLLGLLGAIANAPLAGGANAQPPALDPYLAQLAGPEAIAAARQNYMRNAQAAMPAVARQGGSLADLMNAPGQQAGQQYSQEVAQAAKDAMFLRQMRLAEHYAQGGGNDPFGQMNAGAAVTMMGLPGGDRMQDAAKAQIDPAVLALHNARQANVSGDSDAAASYYLQFLKATGRLNISDRNGAMTLLGGVTPQDLQYISVNPANGTITGASSQHALPGAAETQQKLATANAYGSHAADINPVDTGTGATQQMTNPAARAALGGGGLGAPAAPAAPGAPPPQAPAPAAPLQPASFPLTNTPTMRAALMDASYRTGIPAPKAGLSLTPAQVDTQKKLVDAESTLRTEGDEATKGAATTLTYIKAAQAILGSNGHVPTGVTAPIQSAISRGMAALHMTSGDWASRSQELVKYLGNLALSNAKATYGPRITQNEVRLQLEELSPSQAMQPGAIGDMLDKLGSISQYAIDSADRSRYYLRAQNDPRDFAKWNQQYFPMAETTSPGQAPGLPAGWQVKVR